MSNYEGKERKILKSCQSLVVHFRFNAILKDYLGISVQRFTMVWRVMARTHCRVLIHKDWSVQLLDAFSVCEGELEGTIITACASACFGDGK